MLIDLHEHTGGISFCARKDYKGICQDTLNAGIDGFVLTNHIVNYYPKKHGLDYKGFCEKYLEEFYKTEKLTNFTGQADYYTQKVEDYKLFSINNALSINLAICFLSLFVVLCYTGGKNQKEAIVWQRKILPCSRKSAA